MKISILGSGSEGNSIYLEVNGVSLLIDAGFSAKNIAERLSAINVNPQSIQAILVTHEHTDHIKGVGVMSRKYHIPIYITAESLLVSRKAIGNLPADQIMLIDKSFWLNEHIKVIPFDVDHDANRTVGFRIESQQGKVITISTDIGSVSADITPYFKNADVLVVEANYDLEMLQICSYPYMLKQRIASSSGHLSNDDSGRIVAASYHSQLKKVYLAHVSKNSNTYDMALQAVKNQLEEKGVVVDLEVAHQDIPTSLFAF